jgi:hypothetical protein
VGSASSSELTEWFWEDISSGNSQSWRSFPQSVCSSIEEQYRKLSHQIEIRLNNRDYVVFIDRMIRLDMATGEECRVRRKEPQILAKGNWDFLFEDVNMFCTSSSLVCIVPPKCSPNHQTSKILFRSFDVTTGRVSTDHYIDNFMEQDVPFSCVTYDWKNMKLWGYTAVWNLLHQWSASQASPYSINSIDDAKSLDGLNISEKILGLVSRFSNEMGSKHCISPGYSPFFMDTAPATFESIVTILEYCYSKFSNAILEPDSQLVKVCVHVCSLLLVNVEQIGSISEPDTCKKFLPAIQRVVRLLASLHRQFTPICSSILLSILETTAKCSTDVRRFLTDILNEHSGEIKQSDSEGNFDLRSRLLEGVADSSLLVLLFDNHEEAFAVMKSLLRLLKLEKNFASNSTPALQLSPVISFLLRFQFCLFAIEKCGAFLQKSSSRKMIEYLCLEIIEISRAEVVKVLEDPGENGFDRLRYSCFGLLLPSLVTYLTELLSFDVPHDLIRALLQLLASTSSLMTNYKRNKCSLSWMREDEFIQEVVQSSHPYSKGTVDRTITIPGAIGLAVRFDSRCATQTASHSLKITRSSPRWSKAFSGFGSEGTWPKSFIKLKGDTISFLWSVPKDVVQSDSSNQDSSWGFRCTIYAFIPSLREEDLWIDDTSLSLSLVAGHFIDRLIGCEKPSLSTVPTRYYESHLLQTLSSAAAIQKESIISLDIDDSKLDESSSELVQKCEIKLLACVECHFPCSSESQACLRSLRSCILRRYQTYKALFMSLADSNITELDAFISDQSDEDLKIFLKILNHPFEGNDRDSLLQSLQVALKNVKHDEFTQPLAILKQMCVIAEQYATLIAAIPLPSSIGVKHIFDWLRFAVSESISVEMLLQARTNHLQVASSRVFGYNMLTLSFKSINADRLKDSFLVRVKGFMFQEDIPLLDDQSCLALKNSLADLLVDVCAEFTEFDSDNALSFKALKLVSSISTIHFGMLKGAKLFENLLTFVSQVQTNIESHLSELSFSQLCSPEMSKECSLAITGRNFVNIEM